MTKLLLTIFLALSLANQFTSIHSEPEAAPIFACVPGQANQAVCDRNELNDDQRSVRALAVNFLALPFAPASDAACRSMNRPFELLGRKRPLHQLNAVLLI